MISGTKKQKGESGFVALITAIIISAILLTVAVAMNQVGYLTRGQILDSEYKDRSAALAEACGDTALLKLSEDPSYSGGTIVVGSDSCSIGPIQQDTPASGQVTINTSAVFPSASVTGQGATTKLKIVADSGNFTILSWNEIP